MLSHYLLCRFCVVGIFISNFKKSQIFYHPYSCTILTFSLNFFFPLSTKLYPFFIHYPQKITLIHTSILSNSYTPICDFFHLTAQSKTQESPVFKRISTLFEISNSAPVTADAATAKFLGVGKTFSVKKKKYCSQIIFLPCRTVHFPV